MTETTAEPEKTATFHNPVSKKSMPDPFITYYDGCYYGLATEVTTVKIYKCERVEDRYAYIQKIDFSEDGMPVFGAPLPREAEIEVPSGQGGANK